MGVDLCRPSACCHAAKQARPSPRPQPSPISNSSCQELDESALSLFDELDALVDGLVWDADGLESCYDSAASLLPTPPSSDGSVRDFSPMDITEPLDSSLVSSVVPPNADEEEIIDVIGDGPTLAARGWSPAPTPLSNASTAKLTMPTPSPKVCSTPASIVKPLMSPVMSAGLASVAFALAKPTPVWTQSAKSVVDPARPKNLPDHSTSSKPAAKKLRKTNHNACKPETIRKLDASGHYLANCTHPSTASTATGDTPTSQANPTAKNSADGIVEGQSPITALLQLSNGNVGGVSVNSHDEHEVSDAAQDVMSLLKAYLSANSQDSRDIPLDDASELVLTPMVNTTPTSSSDLQPKDSFEAENSSASATVDAIDAIFDEAIAQLLTPSKEPPLGGIAARATPTSMATPLLEDLTALGLLDPVVDEHSPEAEHSASRVLGSSTAASPVDDAVRQILMALADSNPDDCANGGDGELGDLELDGLVQALGCEFQREEPAFTGGRRRALGGTAPDVGR
ncbi:hypothetical protein HK405_001565 [Cladochytrium tenue]|nr:hypothetical protein HK405_001565 [Cladochytrium tenue]